MKARRKKVPTFAATTSGEIDDQALRHETAEERSAADLRAVLALPEGRRVLSRIVGEARVLGITFDADPRKDAFNQGARHLGLLIRDWVEVADASALADVLIPQKD